MDDSYVSTYHALEGTHWWFLGRRDIIQRFIKVFRKDSFILEIGCSGGPLIGALKECGFENIKGIDINEKAIAICRQKGIHDVRVADAAETGFGNQQFDLIIASDVLEHLKDEDKTLAEWHRILKSGGRLIVFVPAFEFLWSSHDDVNLHYRRYSKSQLINTLQKNGFIAEKSSYWNFCMFLPLSLIRSFQRLLNGRGVGGGQLNKINPFFNKTLGYLLRIENKFLSLGGIFPFGISVFAIARKS